MITENKITKHVKLRYIHTLWCSFIIILKEREYVCEGVRVVKRTRNIEERKGTKVDFNKSWMTFL